MSVPTTKVASDDVAMAVTSVSAPTTRTAVPSRTMAPGGRLRAARDAPQPAAANSPSTRPATAMFDTPKSALSTDGPIERNKPPRDHVATNAGVAPAKAARAAAGTATRGRSDASPPAVRDTVSGAAHTAPASTTNKDSRITKTKRVGAGAYCTSRPEPIAPAARPAVGAVLLTSDPNREPSVG